MKTAARFGGALLIVALAVLLWCRRQSPLSQAALPSEYIPPLPSKDTDKRTLLEKAKAYEFGKSASAYSPSEKAALAKMLQEKFKPALRKWYQAYEGRIPFDPETVTVEQFQGRMGTFLYMFTLTNGIALTLSDSTNGAWVFYMGGGKELRAMNSLPAPGTVPIATTPITKADVLRMVKADTGNVFQASDVTIEPSGLSGALNGGAIVDVGGLKADGFLHMTGTNMHLVFGSDGTLVSYGGPASP